MEKTALFRSFVAAALLLGGANASAITYDDVEDTQGYDSIVKELSREADKPAPGLRLKNKARSGDPFENLWMHFGVGLSSLVQTVQLEGGQNISLGARGVQISGGIDLFSPSWLTEVTYRGFGETQESQATITLQEFELKLFYKSKISSTVALRGGGGLSGRYMSVRRPRQSDITYTTPSSVATLGADYFVNEFISIGADLSGRSAMISDTPDRTSFDATLRLDTHF